MNYDDNIFSILSLIINEKKKISELCKRFNGNNNKLINIKTMIILISTIISISTIRIFLKL